MAVGTLDEVDIVATGGIAESGVHVLDVQAAVGHLGVATGARGARLLRVALVAGQSAYAFMHADGGAIIAGGHLETRQRGMALVT